MTTTTARTAPGRRSKATAAPGQRPGAGEPAATRSPDHIPIVPPEGESLTQRQLRRIRQLPRGHRLLGVHDGEPLVREPGGRLSRMRADGRLVAALRVERVQSYLHVRG